MSTFRKLAVLALAVCSVPAGAAPRLSESEARFAAAELSAPRYGALFEEPSADDLLRDHAHGVAELIRRRLSAGGVLTEELLSEAKHLQRERYSLLEPKDRALVDAALSLRLGGFSVTGPGRILTVAAPGAISPALLAQEDFPTFLEGLRSEAAKDGVPQAVLAEALTGLTVDPKVLAAESSQPEHTITFEQYLTAVVSEKRVAGGKAMLAQHAALLDKVSSAYGLAAQFIVAIWGMESNYGPNQGDMNVVRSLATLAYAGKRPSFFRKELMAALHILADERMSSKDLKGSWAGALGQPQFMPSTFRKLAVDFDGDGRRDIWKSAADVTASMANYLAKAGWDKSAGWGAEVTLPAEFDQASASLSVVKSVADWQAAGARPMPGAVLPAGTLSASVIRPSGPGGRAFLVLPNFRVVMRYNSSTYYATAGGLLADRVQAH
ncbi:MAG: lytic murein transglycosylase [Elusimicrobia bacterium]|nr:lytic murein transglycosylase [Elusimicrobiota bacterium]